MKSLLIIASVIALAFAGPAHRALVTPGGAGPAPVDSEPIAVGPAIIESFEEAAIGPAFVETEPVFVGPTIVDNVVPAATPLVQIILNINGVGQVIDVPEIITPEVPAVVQPVEASPEPIIIGAPIVPIMVPEPVQVVEVAPVEIGAPSLPSPVPDPVEIGAPSLPSPVPDHVVIGTPILPSPVVVLPEDLN